MYPTVVLGGTHYWVGGLSQYMLALNPKPLKPKSALNPKPQDGPLLRQKGGGQCHDRMCWSDISFTLGFRVCGGLRVHMPKGLEV